MYQKYRRHEIASVRHASAVGELGVNLVLLDNCATHFVRKLEKHSPIPSASRECRLKLVVGSVKARKVGCEIRVGAETDVGTLMPKGRCVGNCYSI